ncbi:MAG: hypothetical protein Q8M52_09815, partial [Methylotenera sp.]|nr:hypothetical protein [Methylotenera sp.]
MAKQNAKIFHWEDYVDRLSTNSNSAKTDDPEHGGGGGGFGKTPGQRLKRQTSHICSILQWFLENLTESEWENAAKKHSGIPHQGDFIFALNSSRVKERATPEQEAMLKRIISTFHDHIAAEDRFKDALNDPFWELHN